MNVFSASLVHAVNAKGSILAVASLLHVEPRKVYDWIAGQEPSEAERSSVMARLSEFERLAA